MPARRDGRRRGGGGAFALLTTVALAAYGCGSDPGSGGPRAAKLEAPSVRPLEPTDLLPADLDLVVRVDMARLRAGLGPAATDEIARRAAGAGAEDLVHAALDRADVIWFAARSGEIESGDRVVVVEGRMKGLEPDGRGWDLVRQVQPEVQVYDRPARVPRDGLAQVVRFGEKALVFVSPVEVGSVARVLRDGPDENRGAPEADGLVTVDLRARRLPPALERRFPSVASLVAGLERVRGRVTLVDEGVRLEAQIRAVDIPAAERALRFLQALRDNAAPARHAELAARVELEQIEGTVHVKWVAPAALVLTLVGGAGAGPDKTPTLTPEPDPTDG